MNRCISSSKIRWQKLFPAYPILPGLVTLFITLFALLVIATPQNLVYAATPQLSPYAQTTNNAEDKRTFKSFLSLHEFATQHTYSAYRQVAGIYVPGSFAYSISQQPAGNPGYVSNRNDTITNFSTASRFDTIGLLAHNYLAGNEFFNLSEGQYFYLVFTDGDIVKYKVSDIGRFQALSPYSARSNFRDLDEDRGVLTVSQLFYEVYDQPGKVVLQTCIAKDNVSAWGRLFITAETATGVRHKNRLMSKMLAPEQRVLHFTHSLQDKTQYIY